MAKHLGEFEIIVLAALLRLGDKAYGAAIREDIETRTGRTTSIGAIYTTLSRLEAKDIVSSKLGGATAERGGRAKRFFKITAKGQKTFKASVTSLGNMLEGVTPWLGTVR